MRKVVAAAVACLSLVGLSVAADVQASIKKDIRIPAGGLGPALQALSEERRIHVVFISEDVNKLLTKGASGSLTIDEALHQLLNGTGLTFQYIDNETVSIVPVAAASTPSASSILLPSGTEPSSSTVEEAKGTERKSFWDRLRLAQVDQRKFPNDGSVEGLSNGTQPSQISLEEIIVTAQKRVERLQDVPVPVTVVTSDTLVNTNQVRFEDYYTRIPGLNVTTVGDGATPQLNMRGITTGGLTSPTVSVLIDDIGYGATTFGQGGFDSADLDPADVDRIEALRGPQGTLYGASSMGGLLKYMTSNPATDGIHARVQVGANSVRNADDLGYNVRGSVEGPVSDTWALRASGFKRRDAGYIDSPLWSEEGVNQIDSEGGRLVALWQPSDAFSLKLSAMVQDKEQSGSSGVNPQLGDLQRDLLPGSGGFDRDSAAYSAIAIAEIGAAELTSLTGYSINETISHADTSFLAGLTQPWFGTDFSRSDLAYKTDKVSQELRLATPIGERVEWLVGGFYTHEKTRLHQRVPAVNPTQFVTNPFTGEDVDYVLGQDQDILFEEYALFTDVTFKLTEQFDIQLGGRQSRNEVTYEEKAASGPLYPLLGQPFQFVTSGTEGEDEPFTYLAVARFKPSPDLMMYVRLASGYRAGGPNANPELLVPQGLPSSFEADTTRNYEIGAKGSLLDRKLSFEAALYYIDWQDVQISALSPVDGSVFFVNGRTARSQGVELSTEARPLKGLLISAWAAWNDAEITEDFVTSGVSMTKGERLPYSSEYSGNLTVEQEFPLGGSATTGVVGGSFSYVDDRKSELGFFGILDLPSYTQLDLHAGVRYESWDLNVFVNNVADKRGALAGDPIGARYLYLIRPRTIGLTLSKSF